MLLLLNSPVRLFFVSSIACQKQRDQLLPYEDDEICNDERYTKRKPVNVPKMYILISKKP